MVCLICGKEFKYITTHLTLKHKMLYERYYLEYLKKKKEFCKICGKPALFKKDSYKEYCSKSCLYILTQKKVKETNISNAN